MRAGLYEFAPDFSGEDGASPEHWRDRRPPLILDRRIFRIGGLTKWGLPGLKEVERREVAAGDLRNELLGGISAAFNETGCDIINWPLTSPEVATTYTPEYFKNLENFFGINTIDLGRFNKAQKATFAIAVTDEKSFWQFAEAYNQASQEITPTAFMRSEELNLKAKAPATYVNVLLREVGEDDGVPDSFEPKKLQAMNWVDSAHFGTWKVLQVFWYKDKNGQPQLKTVVLSTLEGSHPQFGNVGDTQFQGELAELAREIGRRFKIFGSVEEIRPNYETDDLEPIPDDVWPELPAVKSLIATGPFLGARDLISGPIEIERLAKSRRLRTFLRRMAGYSQQAESARCLYEPLIDELVVSITGTLGGSKTVTDPGDFVAARPNKKVKNGLLLRKVGDKKPDRPSVEAREFAIPLYKMAEEAPGFTFKVNRNEDGSYKADENGQHNMWRIVGIDHLHRDVIEFNPDKIIKIEPEDYDAVGCGVDANDEKSEYAIKQAYIQGQAFFEEKGYWPTAAVFYVPNHGWNAILFAVENEDGHIAEDLGAGFRQAIEDGDLVYGGYARDVTQV